jgi:hypothetical protein
LDRYLHQRRQQLDQTLAGISDEQQRASERMRQLCQACQFAQDLVDQLSPTMDRIAVLAYHRDVNAHNILISVEETAEQGSQPQFGLVDFGLAVDATKWRGGPEADVHGQGDWQHLDVGGDCRYWPASAWLQFEVGCYELAEHKALCLEYQTHLDLQGLGITALQVLAELLPSMPEHPEHSGTSSDSDCHVLSQMWKLRSVWEEYWEAATSFWTALLDTFRSNGDWNSLKTQFISIGVHDVISRKLQAVRKALRETQEACATSSRGGHFHSFQAFFTVLIILISSGEERGSTTQWSSVLAELTCSRTTSALPHTPGTSSAAQVASPARHIDADLNLSEDSLARHPTPLRQCASRTVGVADLRPCAPTTHLETCGPVASFAGLPPSPRCKSPPRDCHQSNGSVLDIASAAETADIGASGLQVLGAIDGSSDESHDLFLRLSNLATKVVQLAKAMEKLELRDRDLAAAAAGRIATGSLSVGSLEVMAAG